MQKLTMEFNAGRQGWRELFWMDESSLGAAVPKAESFCQLRWQCLAFGYSMDGATLSDPAQKRSGIDLDIPFVNNPNSGRRGTEPWDATDVFLQGSTNIEKPTLIIPDPRYSRHWLVRGLPGNLWLGSAGAGWQISPAAAAPLNRLLNAMNGTVGIRGDLQTQTVQPITAKVQDAGTNVVTITAPTIGLNATVDGKLLRFVTIRGCQGDYRPLNGRHKIIEPPTDVNTFKILAPKLGPSGKITKATAQGVRIGFIPIGYGIIMAPVKKSTGRALHVTKGANKRRIAS